jgi:hypothetical protein
MRHAVGMHDETRPSTGRDAALTFAGWIVIIAPLLAIALKLPTGGWLLVGMVFTFPVWLLGYAAVITAAVSMLRGRGALRASRQRKRAITWAWLTSVGVMLAGFTVVDGGDTARSVASTLALVTGQTGVDSPVNDVSNGIALVAAIAWIVGWLALVIEWMIAMARRRPEAPRVAPPVAAPPAAD